MKLSPLILLCLIFVGLGFGQNVRIAPRSIFEMDAMLDSDLQTNYQINYNRFLNLSTIGSPRQLLNETTAAFFDDRLYIEFFFNFNGRILKKTPEKYFLVINATHADGELLKDNVLYFMADNKTIAAGTGYRNINKIGADVFYALPAESFEYMAGSREIKYKVGKAESELPPNILRSLQELYKLSHRRME